MSKLTTSTCTVEANQDQVHLLPGCGIEDVLNSLPIALYVKNKALNYAWGNSLFTGMCNCRHEDVPGRSAFDLFNDDVAAEAHIHDLKVLETGETQIFDSQVKCCNKEMDLRFVKLPAYGEGKAIVGVISVAYDRSNDSPLATEIVRSLTTLKHDNELLWQQNVELESSLRYAEDNTAQIIEIAETKARESDELRERNLDLESSLAYTEDQANQLAGLAEELDLQRQKIVEHNEHIQHMMYRDDTTGAYSRRYFFDHAPQIIKERAPLQTRGALAILDIDYFKGVNDRYGHLVGDNALRAFVDVVSKNLPDGCVFTRLGGEEFTLLTPPMGQGQVHDFLECVRQTVAAHLISCGMHVFKLTVSIGAVVLNSDDDVLELLRKADHALYEVKSRGRNQIAFYSEAE